MYNRIFHTGIGARTWLLALLLNFSATALAQETDTLSRLDSAIRVDAIVEGRPAENPFGKVTEGVQRPVQPRKVDTAALRKMKSDEAFWYINEVPEREVKKEPAPQPRKPQSQAWLRNLLWVLVVGGFIAILIWFLMASDTRLFRKPATPVSGEEDAEDLTAENLFDLDYRREIRKAIAAGNYRQAIRLLYLQTLKEMALREIIQFRQGRTNSDYLMQLFGTAYYNEFFRLTRSFEYTWYGQFDLSAQAFDQLQSEFSSFHQKLQA